MGSLPVAHSFYNNTPLNPFPTPPPPPLPRINAERHMSAPSVLETSHQNNLLHMGIARYQQSGGSMMLAPLPPPPPPRPARSFDGSSIPTPPSPTSSYSSLSGLKTGPFLKGELAILKREQAVAEAAAAHDAHCDKVVAGIQSRSPSGRLDSSGQRIRSSASGMGRVELRTFHSDDAAVGDCCAYRSFQTPPPPPPPRPTQWHKSPTATPQLSLTARQ